MKKNLYYADLLEIYGKMLTEKQFEPMRLYYHEDYSLSEIGRVLEVSRQAVLSALQFSEAKLDKLEKNIGFWQYLSNEKKTETD